MCVCDIALHFFVLGTKMENSDSIREKVPSNVIRGIKSCGRLKRMLFSGGQKLLVNLYPL